MDYFMHYVYIYISSLYALYLEGTTNNQIECWNFILVYIHLSLSYSLHAQLLPYLWIISNHKNTLDYILDGKGGPPFLRESFQIICVLWRYFLRDKIYRFDFTGFFFIRNLQMSNTMNYQWTFSKFKETFNQ